MERLTEVARYHHLQLPCKLGATVYVITTCKDIPNVLDGSLLNSTGYYCPYDLNEKCPHIFSESCDEVENKLAVFEDTVSGFVYDETGLHLIPHLTNVDIVIGSNAFFTKPEAEKRLATIMEEQAMIDRDIKEREAIDGE